MRVIEVQTRSEENGIDFHSSIADAMKAAEKDPSIWKISFYAEGKKERVRLLKHSTEGDWVYEPIHIPIPDVLK